MQPQDRSNESYWVILSSGDVDAVQSSSVFAFPNENFILISQEWDDQRV